jgi:hypothetical protein
MLKCVAIAAKSPKRKTKHFQALYISPKMKRKQSQVSEINVTLNSWMQQECVLLTCIA